MPQAHFQVQLSLDTKSGRPQLLLPEAMNGLEFRCLIVKEGGAEAIVEVEAPADTLKKLEKRDDVKKLTPKQADQLRAGYPAPKLKKKYRLRAAAAGAAPSPDMYEVDSRGERILDTFQTVRSGFHLIDVPVSDAQ